MTQGVERIAIPVGRDRTPEATTRCAVTVAHQSDLPIEFVASSTTGRRAEVEAVLRKRCDDAAAAGASRPGWRLVDGDASALESYLSWSGPTMLCQGPRPPARSAGTPVLVVGRHCRPSSGGYRRIVAGVDTEDGVQVAAVAASMAGRLGVELMLIEVVGPAGPAIDVPVTAHVAWLAASMPERPRHFDTVPAGRPADGLCRLLDAAAIVVVGTGRHHHGVAARLARHAPCPVLVVPVRRAYPTSPNVLHCRGSPVS